MRAAAADPACVLAAALVAHFIAPKDPAKASAYLATAADNLGKATDYERAVFKALSALVGEEKDGELALERRFELLKEFPRDLTSLIRAQLMGFHKGQSELSLKFVETLCHVFQQECRFREATEFMASCCLSRTACTSFLFTHNWWHVAVCYLEGESPLHKVLEVYDQNMYDQNIMKELERSD